MNRNDGWLNPNTDVFDPPLKHAILLDRDGVINYEREDYVKDTSEFRFIEGVFRALSELKRSRLPVVIITNQSGIGRGVLTEANLLKIHSYMVSEVKRHDGDIQGIFYCPHRPEDKCACRKPGTLLFEQARDALGFSLAESWFIGDKQSDDEAGKACHCKTVIVRPNTPNALHQAVRTILAQIHNADYTL